MRLSVKLALALSALGLASAAGAAITNGDFESGNLNGWSSYTSNSDDVIFGAEGSVATVPSASVGAPAGAGENVAFLHAGRVDDYQLLWQDFSTISGASLSMMVKWAGNDTIYYDYPYNDDGYARIAQLDGNGDPLSWTTIWDASIAEYGNVDGPNGGASPWMTASYNFASSGSYRLEFGIRNVGVGDIGDDDEMSSSELFVDNVALTEPVPEPGEWAMLIAGVGVVGMVASRRKNLAV